MATDPVLLVAGSLHYDMILRAPHLPARDETVAGSGLAHVFGGKGGNQAVAAARMGARVHMAGAVGDDMAGRALRAALTAAGVDSSAVATVPGASGMSVAIVDDAGDYAAVILSGANLGIQALGTPLPQTSKALLLQNEIPAEANLAFAQRAKAAQMKVILNAAPARATDPALLALVDLLVVNRGEAAAILGLAYPPQEAARALALLGPAEVIVTLGAEGLAALAFVQPALPAQVVSTHGAGDAFIGALAAEWARGADLATAARFGQAMASLTVSTPPDARHEITPSRVRALLA